MQHGVTRRARWKIGWCVRVVLAQAEVASALKAHSSHMSQLSEASFVVLEQVSPAPLVLMKIPCYCWFVLGT
eukprot:5663877-Amphidinium_carterae.1